jgi:hypothetical protein
VLRYFDDLGRQDVRLYPVYAMLAFGLTGCCCSSASTHPCDGTFPKERHETSPTVAVVHPVERLKRCLLHAYGDTDCVEKDWVAAEERFVPRHNFEEGNPSFKADLYNFYIGRVSDKNTSKCVDVDDLFGSKDLLAAKPALLIFETIGTLTSAEYASEEALAKVSASLGAKLGAAYTPEIKAKFETNFRREVRTQSQSQANSLARLVFYEIRLDGDFKERSGKTFAETYTSFLQCRGLRVVSGVVGFFVAQMTVSSLSSAEAVLATALKNSLEASLGVGKVEAGLAMALDLEVRNSVSARSELNVGLNSMFVPVWYRTQPVPGALGADGRRCKAGTIQVVTKVADATANKANEETCRGSLDGAKQPPQPKPRKDAKDTTVAWTVGELECRCHEDK